MPPTPPQTAPSLAAEALRRVDWPAVFAGAVAAAAISFVLLTFGAAVGLSATSAWPDSGMSVTMAAILMGAWIALVQAGSFAAGGYVAGRLRGGAADPSRVEREFGDGAHGFLVWGVGVLLGAILAGGAISGATKVAVESGTAVAAGAVGGMASGGAQRGGITLTPADYATDYLLRTGPDAQPPAAAAPSPRPEVARVLIAAVRDGSLPARERTWLAQLVSQRTGLPQADAERRVDEAFAEAKAAEEKVRDAADRARKAGALAGFLAAAALAVGCVAATAGAASGARHREAGTASRLFGKPLW
jgi:hypothetical protein